MSFQRPRALPNGALSNGAPNGYAGEPSQQSGADALDGEASNISNMTRAQRFEDEKRRIVNSCFTKRDDDGSCTCNFSIVVIPFAIEAQGLVAACIVATKA